MKNAVITGSGASESAREKAVRFVEFAKSRELRLALVQADHGESDTDLSRISMTYSPTQRDDWGEGSLALHPNCYPPALPIHFREAQEDWMGVTLAVSDPSFLTELRAVLAESQVPQPAKQGGRLK